MHECYQSEKKKTWAEFVHFKTWRHRFASGIKRRRHNCSEDKFVIYILPPWLCSVSVFSELSTLFVCVCVCVTQKQVEMCPSTKQRPGFSHPTAVPPRKINSSPVVVCSSACVYIWECVFKSTFFNCHNSFYNTVPLLWPVFGAEIWRVRLMNWHVLLSSSSCRYSPTCDCTRWIHVVGDSFVFRHSERLTRLRAREGETWKTAGLRREGPSE